MTNRTDLWHHHFFSKIGCWCDNCTVVIHDQNDRFIYLCFCQGLSLGQIVTSYHVSKFRFLWDKDEQIIHRKISSTCKALERNKKISDFIFCCWSFNPHSSFCWCLFSPSLLGAKGLALQPMLAITDWSVPKKWSWPENPLFFMGNDSLKLRNQYYR